MVGFNTYSNLKLWKMLRWIKSCVVHGRLLSRPDRVVSGLKGVSLYSLENENGGRLLPRA